MARTARDLAETKKTGSNKRKRNKVLLFIRLVDQVRKAKDKQEEDEAFEAILDLMQTKLMQISYKFRIPGLGVNDVYQEALYALRFKAIKDYDKTRSKVEKISPFDRFAMLCIRRHLSTKLKASYQNKSIVLNSSISLDQDRNTGNQDSDGILFLSDILPRTKKDVFTQLKEREYYSILMTNLYQRLSHFERQVLVLYMQKHSYQEISDRINRNKKVYRINVKSIDNALGRIKQKARDVYARHG